MCLSWDLHGEPRSHNRNVEKDYQDGAASVGADRGESLSASRRSTNVAIAAEKVAFVDGPVSKTITMRRRDAGGNTTYPDRAPVTSPTSKPANTLPAGMSTGSAGKMGSGTAPHRRRSVAGAAPLTAPATEHFTRSILTLTCMGQEVLTREDLNTHCRTIKPVLPVGIISRSGGFSGEECHLPGISKLI
jgi:hypothetical protein